MNVRENIAKNIAGLRKQKGMTQAELADKLCYSNKSISKWERADSLPDAEILYRIAEFFNVEISFLFEEHEFNKLDDEENRILEKRRLKFKLAFFITTIVVLIVLAFLILGSVLVYVEMTSLQIASIVFFALASLCFLGEGILIIFKIYKYTRILSSLILWFLLIGLELLLPVIPWLLIVAAGVVIQTLIIVIPRFDELPFVNKLLSKKHDNDDKKDTSASN